MFKNLKIAIRLQLGFVIVLIIALAMVVPVVNIKISDVVHEAEMIELRNLYKSAMAEIESEGRLAQAMSYIIASNQEMSMAMAEGRRDDLAARTVPLFKNLNEQYSVRQFQFHLPPAVSFLRAHKAKKFGDDLSSFRKTILATNDSKKPVKGLEKGVAGLGIRGINPVFYEDKHIGSVEFGMSFGQAFFDKFKEKYGVDIALHVSRNNEFKIFGGTLRANEKNNVSKAKDAYLIAADSFDRSAKIYIKLIKNTDYIIEYQEDKLHLTMDYVDLTANVQSPNMRVINPSDIGFLEFSLIVKF